MDPSNGWERWRGGVDRRLHDLEGDVEIHRRWLGKLEGRVQRIEIRVAVYAAIGSLAGLLIAEAGHWLLKAL